MAVELFIWSGRSKFMKNILIFLAGIGVGVISTYKVISSKEQERADEEIKSVKKKYKEMYLKTNECKTEESSKNGDGKEEKKMVRQYNDTISENGYGTSDQVADAIYTITPEQYVENNGYDKLAMSYFENEVLTDEVNDPVDIDQFVGGIDIFDNAGEYDEDELYVRNDRLGADIEIEIIHGNYVGN